MIASHGPSPQRRRIASSASSGLSPIAIEQATSASTERVLLQTAASLAAFATATLSEWPAPSESAIALAAGAASWLMLLLQRRCRARITAKAASGPQQASISAGTRPKIDQPSSAAAAAAIRANLRRSLTPAPRPSLPAACAGAITAATVRSSATRSSPARSSQPTIAARAAASPAIKAVELKIR